MRLGWQGLARKGDFWEVVLLRCADWGNAVMGEWLGVGWRERESQSCDERADGCLLR